MPVNDPLTQTIIGGAIRVHKTLGPGYLESVYRSALAHELTKAGLRVACEHKIAVFYDGVVVGQFAADMLVEDAVLLELKAVRELVLAHEVQLVHYLTATGLDVGLLIDFGAATIRVRRKYRDYVGKGLKTGRQEEQEGHENGQPLVGRFHVLPVLPVFLS